MGRRGNNSRPQSGCFCFPFAEDFKRGWFGKNKKRARGGVSVGGEQCKLI